MFDRPEVRFAVDAVRRASELVRQVQREMVTAALVKQDRSPVTVADFAAQAVIGYLLQQTFPDDLLVGEEDAAALREPQGRRPLDRVTEFVGRIAPGASPEAVCRWIDRGGARPAGRFWTLDPVDGTKGFLRGEQYAVALALLVDGRPQVGVLGCPNLSGGCRPEIDGEGSLLCAVAGEGAWTAPLGGRDSGGQDVGDDDFQRLRVSDRDDPAAARLLRSVESGHTNVDAMGELAAALGAVAEPVLMDSQAKYAVLAAGQGDLLFRLLSPAKPDYREKIWDQAAGSLVVEEAGGRVTDLDGRRLDFTRGRTLAGNRGVAASNGRLHELALEAIKRIGA